MTLASLPGKEVDQFLRQCLGAGQANVRVAALSAIYQRKDSLALGLVEKMAQQDPSGQVRIGATNVARALRAHKLEPKKAPEEESREIGSLGAQKG